MNLPALLGQYGYSAVFLGTFLEGETVLIMAGFLAHQGYLKFDFILLAAFCGTLLGDQFYYYVGRTHGAAFLERRGLGGAVQKVRRWLDRRGVLLVLGFRFLYGLRTAAPLVIGASRFPFGRYLALNAIGAAVWCVVIGGMGYLFGQALEVLIADLKRYEHLALLVLALAGAVAAVWVRRTMR